MVDGHHSKPMSVVSGVPQGAVRGPILFIIYINGLQDVVKTCKTGSFADDTKLQGKIDVAEDTITVQEDLERVIAWSKKNNMVLHEDNFIHLRYGATRSSLLDELPFTAELGEYATASGHTLRPAGTARDLGVNVSSDYT